MGGMILLMVLTPIPERYGVAPGDREYMMTFFISGLTAIINEWLKGDCADDIGHIISVMQRCIPESRQ
jgi:hypothetical protein